MKGLELPEPVRSAFYTTVWQIVREIPAGQVASYGQIAGMIPLPPGVSPENYKAFRARWVGTAMAACPPDVPWQRVVNAKGEISPRPGAEHQRQLLEAEGILFNSRQQIDLKRYGWRGPAAAWLAANGLIDPSQQISLF